MQITDHSPHATDASRAAARRQQILAAAAQCFREHGFHGASIARISKIAGMSAGHIYHYFENKEAIIAAIVAQDLETLLTLTAELRAACNVRDALIERAAEGVLDQLDPDGAALKVEIVAEAARNPHVARIVREADATCRRELMVTIRAIRSAAGRDDTAEATADMGGSAREPVRRPAAAHDPQPRPRPPARRAAHPARDQRPARPAGLNTPARCAERAQAGAAYR